MLTASWKHQGHQSVHSPAWGRRWQHAVPVLGPTGSSGSGRHAGSQAALTQARPPPPAAAQTPWQPGCSRRGAAAVHQPQSHISPAEQGKRLSRAYTCLAAKLPWFRGWVTSRAAVPALGSRHLSRGGPNCHRLKLPDSLPHLHLFFLWFFH